MRLLDFWRTRRARRRFARALRDYGVQAERLQDHIDRNGFSGYVPPLEGGTYRGRSWTWTSWTEDATDSLPKADAIGLTNAAGEQLIRLWGDVEAVCGPFTADETLRPVRYHGAWPSSDAWARLKAEYPTPEWGPDL